MKRVSFILHAHYEGKEKVAEQEKSKKPNIIVQQT